VASTDAKTGTAGATGTYVAVAEATATGGKGSAGTPATSFDTLVGLPRVDDDASEDNGSSPAITATAGAAQAAATAAAVAAADSGRSAGLGAAAAGSAGAAGSVTGGASASSSAKGAAGAAGRLAAKVAGPSVRTPAAAGAVAAGVVGGDDTQVVGSAPVVTVAPVATHDDGTSLAASAAAQAAAKPAGPAGGADMAGDAGSGVTGAAVPAAPATVAALAAARAAASAASAQGGTALAASSGADKHVSAAGVSVAGAGAGAEAGGAAGVFPLNASTASGAATDSATTPTVQLHAGVDSGEFAQALSDRVTYLVGNGMNGARLQVNPPQLGPIELRIAVSGDHAQVWMTTHSAVTRDALESSSPKLREMLGAQGFGAVSVNISQRSFQDRSGQAQPYQRTASAERGGVAPLTAGANPSAGSRAPAGGLDAYA